MTLKLGTQQKGLEPYKVCINDDPGLTLTYFTTRSTLFIYMIVCFNIGKVRPHFQTSSPQKPLDQLKSDFDVGHLCLVGTKAHIISSGLMTQMAVMPIYGKKTFKISPEP